MTVLFNALIWACILQLRTTNGTSAARHDAIGLHAMMVLATIRFLMGDEHWQRLVDEYADRLLSNTEQRGRRLSIAGCSPPDGPVDRVWLEQTLLGRRLNAVEAADLLRLRDDRLSSLGNEQTQARLLERASRFGLLPASGLAANQQIANSKDTLLFHFSQVPIETLPRTPRQDRGREVPGASIVSPIPPMPFHLHPDLLTALSNAHPPSSRSNTTAESPHGDATSTSSSTVRRANTGTNISTNVRSSRQSNANGRSRSLAAYVSAAPVDESSTSTPYAVTSREHSARHPTRRQSGGVRCTHSVTNVLGTNRLPATVIDATPEADVLPFDDFSYNAHPQIASQSSVNLLPTHYGPHVR